MPNHFYNDNDPFAAAWLQQLIMEDLIPTGVVNAQSIVEIREKELAGFTSAHFFAGIGGWPFALRLAGWPDDLPVWTGSCPCQPFSQAGKRKGKKDPRHLWPAFRSLIRQFLPPTIFGEQVASKDGRLWLSGVRADLEALGYAVGAADLCAAGVGAPHIRQRLFWVAHAYRAKFNRRSESAGQYRRVLHSPNSGITCSNPTPVSRDRMANSERNGRRSDKPQRQKKGRIVDRRTCTRLADAHDSRPRSGKPHIQNEAGFGRNRSPVHSEAGGVEHADSSGRQELRGAESVSTPLTRVECASNPWERYILIECADGKSRRIESGLAPLVDGIPGRVGMLRGYGNAIVPTLAAQFVRAFMDARLVN